MATLMHQTCIIFDLDGTLVDSERLCNQAFIDLIPNLRLDTDELVTRFRGMKLSEIITALESEIGVALSDDFVAKYRAHVSNLFDTNLRPFPGVIDALDQLKLPICVASSGPSTKINQALRVAKLSRYFENRVFSSYDVGSWKPDPGLFLHAAQEMGVSPANCIVIEDSLVGISAAHAAGMPCIFFNPTGISISELAAAVFGNYANLQCVIDSIIDARVS